MKRSLKRVKLKRSSCRFFLFGAVFIFLIYLPVLNSYFLGEDYAWWNCVKGKNTFEVLRYFIIPPSRALGGWYHPLVGVFYWLNVNLSWMKPLGFHLTNLALHIGVYLLVVALGYFFFKGIWPALLAGLLFTIFPFHSEAVAWIDGRHDLLMTFFYLLSFYLFLRWNESKKRILLGFSVFSFFLALSAKEMAVTLPLALVVLRCQGKPPGRWTRLAPTVFYWLVLVFYFFLHAAYVGHFNPFGAASHVGIVISRVLVLYLIFLGISLVFFFLTKKSKIWDQRHLKLIPLLAILIGVFYFPAAFTYTEERYLYLPSTMTCIFAANLFFLFWSNKLTLRRQAPMLVIGDSESQARRACRSVSTLRASPDALRSEHSGLRLRGRSDSRRSKTCHRGLEGLTAKKLVKAAMLSGLLFVSVASTKRLVNRVYDWKKASEIAQGVVNEFKSYSGKISENSIVYFLNLPDNYQGSYIFRTHTAEAICYGSGKEVGKIIIMPRILGRGESAVEIVDRSNFVLRSEVGYLIFAPAISQVLPSGQTVIETEDYYLSIEHPGTLDLILKKDYLGKEGVFFFEYQDGGLKIL